MFTLRENTLISYHKRASMKWNWYYRYPLLDLSVKQAVFRDIYAELFRPTAPRRLCPHDAEKRINRLCLNSACSGIFLKIQ